MTGRSAALRVAAAAGAVAVLAACGSFASAPSGTGQEEVGASAIAQGQAAITRYGCGACHEIPGVTGASGRAAAPLEKFSRRGFIAGQLANTPENLEKWLKNPQAVEPGTAMPDLGLTEDDARNISAYLYSLK